MAEIFNFNLKPEDYLKLADVAYKASEIEKSVVYVDKALEIDPLNIEAMLYLASIYSDLGSYDLSNRVLYSAYSKSVTEFQKTSAVAALVNNFYELGNDEAAEFYLNEISSNWQKFEEIADVEVVGDIDEDYEEEEFTLAYPRTKEFYYEQLEQAHFALQNREYDEALEYLEVFNENTPLYDSSNHLKLVCYLLKDDIDRVIYEAGEILKKSDYLPISCTLITAYMIEEKNDVALELLDKLLLKDYTKIEEITVLLPLLVNFDMHSEVVKYTKRLLDLSELQPQTMIWLSQGLYNLGQKEEATKIMRRIATIYKGFTAAEFYLGYYLEQPEKIEYCLGLPVVELVNRQTRLRKFLALSDDECSKALLYDKNTFDLIKWCFQDLDGKSLIAVISKLNSNWNTVVEKFYIESLLTKDVGLNIGSLMIEGLLMHKSSLNFYVTLDGKCKLLNTQIPDALTKLPQIYISAYATAIFEALVNVDDATESLETLCSFVNGFCTLDEHGKLEWLIPHYDKALHFKSMQALVGLFVLKSASANENEIKNIAEFYAVSPTTLKRYLKILSGELK